MKIILASTSLYRKQLLSKLGLPFDTISPICDETPLEQESSENLALRLSQSKALSLGKSNPDAIIIGSDQVCDLNGMKIGKPHSFEKANEQLHALSGNVAVFYTGLCVFCPEKNLIFSCVDETHVTFRHLSDHEVIRYLNKEKPYNCAGSFKSEGLGISLFSSIKGDDPNSLVGLPLIKLVDYLKFFNLNPLLC